MPILVCVKMSQDAESRNLVFNLYCNCPRPTGPMPFPLSDACSLLLRLQMFNEGLQKGELRERWRELGQGQESQTQTPHVPHICETVVVKKVSNKYVL